MEEKLISNKAKCSIIFWVDSKSNEKHVFKYVDYYVAGRDMETVNRS